MTHYKHVRFLGSALLALSSFACSSATGSDEGAPRLDDEATAGSTGTNAAAAIELTPKYVAQVRAQNAKVLEAAGLFYTLQAGTDHDLMFLEPATGGFEVVERIGPDADESIAQDQVLTQHLSPTAIFQHYKPDAEIPGVIADATARLYPSAEQLAGMQETPVAAADDDNGTSDPGYSLLPGPGLAAQHTTSDGAHFRDDNHTYGDVTDKGCPTITGQTLKICWLNHSGGGYADKTSTHLVAHFGIYTGGSTSLGLKENGSLKWEITVLQGESWRVTANGPWECPGLFCVYYGYTARTWRVQWNGTGKNWHFGGTWYDMLRN